jgi:citrate synthase
MDPSNAAAARLAVLGRHLVSDGEHDGRGLHRVATRGQNSDVRPAPGGGKGTLTVVDNRTGKKYTVRRRGVQQLHQAGGTRINYWALCAG